MKGLIKYKQKFYKKSKRTRNVKEGDLVKIECRRNSDYFKYNGIYTVEKWGCIHVMREGETIPLALKLGYNIFYTEFHVLIPAEKKKSLPNVLKEDEMCGYMA